MFMVTKGLPSTAMAAAPPRPTKYVLKEGVEPEEVTRLLRAEDIGVYRRMLDQLVIERLEAQLTLGDEGAPQGVRLPPGSSPTA
jgi:hypothetical protein